MDHVLHGLDPVGGPGEAAQRVAELVLAAGPAMRLLQVGEAQAARTEVISARMSAMWSAGGSER